MTATDAQLDGLLVSCRNERVLWVIAPPGTTARMWPLPWGGEVPVRGTGKPAVGVAPGLGEKP